MGREGGRKENALVFKREGREGSWEAVAVSLGIPHNLVYFGGSKPRLRCFLYTQR